MYAQRFQPSHGSRPFSAGAALAVNAAIFGALVFAVPNFVRGPERPPTVIDPIPLTPDPPPLDKPQPKVKDPARPRDETLYAPKTPLDTHTTNDTTTTTEQPTQPEGPVIGTVPDGGTVIETPPPPPPLVNATLDPRYAGDLQPPYPMSDLRAGREGAAVVRVLIGTDGRVRAVEKVRADSDSFFDATKRQALSRWHFRPATRGGVAEESWREMTVRFRLDQ